ncbi:MAG: single-stranded-DNA-specific exonuclease RecJ, partial [Pseudomonadota bacterium]|nr:single-stranded-DNA-specific exonuclease RecJ [Pseudomonadota bacterium]
MTVEIHKRVYDQKLLGSLNLDNEILERIFLSRGITRAEDLNKSLKILPNPKLLKNIDAAMNRLFSALMNDEIVMVIGDFDCDGASSTALMMLALSEMGFKNIKFLVPDRFKLGYGLTEGVVDLAIDNKTDLIITVDNGISSISGVQYARLNNIDCIITDHHIAPDSLPQAVAIINPNQKNCNFPAKNLAGVGVAFFFIAGFRTFLREKNWFEENNIEEPFLANYLDLVALGTICDVVPLDKVNRCLIYQGMQRIQNDKCRQGIKKLVDLTGLKIKLISPEDIGYRIGPYLNAAGRLDDISLGIKCLVSENSEVTKTIAAELEKLNHRRKTLQQEMEKEANHEVEALIYDQKLELPEVICLFKKDWHEGIIGLIASRMKEIFDRPVVVFTLSESGDVKGSARSINGFHIRDALEKISEKNEELIIKFGGHAKAAGLTIKEDGFEIFQNYLIEIFHEMFGSRIAGKKLSTDGNLPSEYMNLEMAKLLKDSGPWGEGFPRPSFEGYFHVCNKKTVGQKHIRLDLSPTDNRSLIIPAIYFNADLAFWENLEADQIFCIYELDVNLYRNFESLQL